MNSSSTRTVLLFLIAGGLALFIPPSWARSDDCTGRPESECEMGAEFSLTPPPGYAFSCKWTRDSDCVSIAGRSFFYRGDKGAGISELQGLLQKYGDKVPATGTFDEDTEKAVRKFQKQHDLKVDGRVGAETLKRLRGSK